MAGPAAHLWLQKKAKGREYEYSRVLPPDSGSLTPSTGNLTREVSGLKHRYHCVFPSRACAGIFTLLSTFPGLRTGPGLLAVAQHVFTEWMVKPTLWQ